MKKTLLLISSIILCFLVGCGAKPDGIPITDTPEELPLVITYTFNADGGSFETGLRIYEVDINEEEVLIVPGDPIKEGHDFLGWDKDFSNATEDITVTAMWKLLPGTTGLEYYFNGAFYIVDSYSGDETEVYVPIKYDDGVNGLANVANIRGFAFSGCTHLESIILPSSITSIGVSAFADCVSLTNIEMSDNVSNIGESAFYNCKAITNFKTPLGLTILKELSFAGCVLLVDFEISENIKAIEKEAFSECISLTKIVIKETVLSMEESVFTGCTSLTIYCEAESIPDAWDNNWNPDNRLVEWGYIA